jgi:transposase-like protein
MISTRSETSMTTSNDTLTRIAEVAADVFGVPRPGRGKKPTAAVTRARDAAISLVRQRTGASRERIARAFGVADSVVSNALRRHSSRATAADRLLALTVAEVDAILARLIDEGRLEALRRPGKASALRGRGVLPAPKRPPAVKFEALAAMKTGPPRISKGERGALG